MKLTTRLVEKPWGRTDVPAIFGDTAGRRIGEVWFEDPAGDAAPLMVKYLFTSERLSIQVHPDDASARAAGYPRGKEECWLVLDADPGAELGVGLVRDSDAEELRAAAMNGSIEDMIDWRPARTGDFVYNSAGTIHAIGAGLTVVEVQQNVDCTYRLYDYGRPRELHLDEGLAVSNTGTHRDPRDRRIDDSATLHLVDGPHFNLVRVRGVAPAGLFPDRADFTIIPLSGTAIVDGETISPGECALTTSAASCVLSPDAVTLLCWPCPQEADS